MHSQISKVNIDGTHIAYRQLGNPDGQAMLLVHGMAETNFFFWDHLVSELKDEYNIIAIDLLGHGDSDKPLTGYGAKNQAYLYVKLLEKLSITEAILIGHSLGGIISSRIATDYPHVVKKLVLYDAPIPRGFFGNALLLPHMKPLAVLSITPLIIPGIGLLLDLIMPPFLKKISMRSVLSTWRVPYDPANFTEAFGNQAIRNKYFSLEQAVRFLFLFHDLQKHLPRIESPTLIIIGDDDALLSVKRAQQVKAIIPNAEIEIIKEAGHLALIDQPEVFLNHLLNYLNS